VTTILTFCAASAEGPDRSSLELLAGALQLKEKLGGTVTAALFGAEVEPHAATLVQHGAEQVVVVSHPRLKALDAQVILEVLEQIVRQVSPSVILFPSDLLGGEIGPRLAYRLKAGIVTDCLGFEVKTDAGAPTIRWLRPTHGSKAMAYMSAQGALQIATIRSRAIELPQPDPARPGQVRAWTVDLDTVPSPVKLIEKIQQAEEGISLDQAQVVVSGGRGMGGPEGFVVLEKLAKALGAAVAGSRPAADSGWVPHSRLVGQTGKIVAPRVYIAVGISGAPQHMAGAGSSKTIVAINKDEDAPIFKAAHIGVVGEWQQVIGAFTEACQKLMG
jgi:electron transfer flavoprotein alpha subunit